MTAPRVEARSGAAALLVLAGLVAVGCGRTVHEAPATLRLVKPRLSADPAAHFQDGVYLNEELKFYFSADVDRASVTHDSVRVVDEAGRPARGTLRVEGACVRFTPALPLASDLADAGFLPGKTYAVEITGFPSPEGLRSVDGAPLAASIVARFATVRADDDRGGPRTWLLFDDRSQLRAGVLKPFPPQRGLDDVYSTSTQGSIFFTSDKPIDPTTIRESDFRLESGNRQVIPLSVRLVENLPTAAPRPRPEALRGRAGIPEGWEKTLRAAVIEVTPRETPHAGTPYKLELEPDAEGQLALRDFSGQSLLWPPNRAVNVTFREPRTDGPAGTYSEDFLRTALGSYRSAAAVPGCDGTLAWRDTGRVEVGYPAAAGTGELGAIELGAVEERADVNATRMVLPRGTSCRWGSARGLCVLRSQGSMTIAGELVRHGATTSATDLERLEPELFADAGSQRGDTRDDARAPIATSTLSDWLVRASTRGPSWSVLVAGGDLTIEGRVEVDGPLLLCAGGVIRVPGEVRGAGDSKIGQVWILGEGGGLAVHPAPNVVKQALVADRPIGPNPLREPLRLCVQSQALPQSGSVLRWLSVEPRGSEVGRNGTWRVHFLSARDVPLAQDYASRWVENPSLLPTGADGLAEPLVYVVEVELPVGGAWDPPFVDALRLVWEERRGGAR